MGINIEFHLGHFGVSLKFGEDRADSGGQLLALLDLQTPEKGHPLGGHNLVLEERVGVAGDGRLVQSSEEVVDGRGNRFELGSNLRLENSQEVGRVLLFPFVHFPGERETQWSLLVDQRGEIAGP